MKRFLISTAAVVMIAGSMSLPAVAQQGRGPQGPAPHSQSNGGQSNGGYGAQPNRGPVYQAPAAQSRGNDNRNYDQARGNDRRDDMRGNDWRNPRPQQVSQYHNGRSEWRDTRRNATWNDRDHNGYYIGKVWHRGQPSARDYRRKGFVLAYRPWERGDRLGAYNDRYREVDYRDYRVERPPQGYHWVKSDGGDLILAALAGGLIAAIIANN